MPYRRAFYSSFCALLALSPVIVLAQATSAATGALFTNGLSNTTLDLAQGPLAEVIATTRTVALQALPLALILGFIVEAFGAEPGSPRNYGAVIWRFILVLFLLRFYTGIFGSFISYVIHPIAAAVAPFNGLGDFLHRAIVNANVSTPPAPASPSSPGQFSFNQTFSSFLGMGGVGGYVFYAILDFLMVVAEALVLVVNQLGIVLAALMICLGPLALVASVPRPVRTGTRWFQALVTFLCWPIVSGLMLRVMAAMGSSAALSAGGAMSALVTAFLIGAMALSTPRVSAQLVDGVLENIAARGVKDSAGAVREAARVGGATIGTARAGLAMLGSRASGSATSGESEGRDSATDSAARHGTGSVTSNPPS